MKSFLLCYIAAILAAGSTSAQQPGLRDGAPTNSASAGSERPDMLSLSAADTNVLTQSITASQERLAPAVAVPRFITPVDAETRTRFENERRSALAQKRAQREELEYAGAAMRGAFGPHRVEVARNLNTAGAVELNLPGNKGRLRSHVLGLFYLDPVSGECVLISGVKSSWAEYVPPSKLLYRDAFESVSADVIYTYTRNSFEQFVVIRKALPLPEEYGMSSDSAQLAVLTEFIDWVPPRIISKTLSVRDSMNALGAKGNDLLQDQTLVFSPMRMTEGRAFSLGSEEDSVPVVKSWQSLEDSEGNARQVLIESTPFILLKPQLDRLSAGLGPRQLRKPGSLRTLLGQLPMPPVKSLEASAPIETAQADVNDERGVVIDYLIVNTPLINIDFEGGYTGFAATGQTGWDCWNTYYGYGQTLGALSDLYWSDYNPSAVGIVVSNAPGSGWNYFCQNFMYATFAHPNNGANMQVVITNLPSDEYDLFVYATRASDLGAPRIQLKRNGTVLWDKGTTIWGNGWYQTPWEEGEQYVRFRHIAVTNQNLVLDCFPDASGFASISGLQIVPSAALPSDAPEITKLLNINFSAYDSNKVGIAAAGLSANDFWNGVYHSGSAKQLPNLKWSDQSSSSAGLTVLNGPGGWGTSLPDPMLRTYNYPGNGGNITLVLTNLPSGNSRFYLYHHTLQPIENTIFELWSGDIRYGIKGTSLYGYGYSSNAWEIGQQYVVFDGVTVSSNEPVRIHVKHNTTGYACVSGLQIAYTSDDTDVDADALPDSWEMKWIGNLDSSGDSHTDGDGLSNLLEYRWGFDPLRGDSDGNGTSDLWQDEFPWIEDSSPLGAYLYGTAESWSWTNSWWDGVGWGGGTVQPQSGSLFHVSANVPNAVHQHYCERAVSVVRPQAGDILYAYINLDSAFPPSQIMLQFYTMENNGTYSWNHRAYWGANLINWGTDGTPSRRYMGPLPAAGQWVRLAMPASELDLEGRIIEGMAFTLYGGRAAWDSAGKLIPIDSDGDGIPDYIEDLNGNGVVDSGETDPNNPADLGLKVIITRPHNGSVLP